MENRGSAQPSSNEEFFGQRLSNSNAGLKHIIKNYKEAMQIVESATPVRTSSPTVVKKASSKESKRASLQNTGNQPDNSDRLPAAWDAKGVHHEHTESSDAGF